MPHILPHHALARRSLGNLSCAFFPSANAFQGSIIGYSLLILSPLSAPFACCHYVSWSWVTFLIICSSCYRRPVYHRFFVWVDSCLCEDLFCGHCVPLQFFYYKLSCRVWASVSHGSQLSCLEFAEVWERIGGLLWAFLFLLLETNSEPLEAEPFPVYSDILLEKAKGAASGPRALEVVLLMDCFGPLSSWTGRCPRKEGSKLKWEKKCRHRVNEQRWKQLVLHQSWVLRAQTASSEAWSLPSNKRCFSGSIGNKSHCSFREMITWWLLTTNPCSSSQIWRNCAARVCTMGEI